MFIRSKKTRATNRRNRPRSIRMESLEKRELMAANVWLSGTDVRIEADDAGQRVEVSQVGSDVQVANIFPSGVQYTSRFPAAAVDRIFFDGGEGNDTFVNRTGIKSTALGHGGDDTLIGGTGSQDVLDGGAGNDTLVDYGGGTASTEGQLRYFDRNYLSGGEDNDTLIVYSGANFLDGGSGNDTMYGGVGADLMVGGTGNDFMFGNAGNDFLYGADMDWAPSWEGEITRNEYFCYGTDRDVLIGGFGADKLEGGPGNDYLDGGQYGMPDGARDTLMGGTGNDTFVTYYRRVSSGGSQYLIPYMEDAWQDVNRRYYYRSSGLTFYDSYWQDRLVFTYIV